MDPLSPSPSPKFDYAWSELEKIFNTRNSYPLHNILSNYHLFLSYFSFSFSLSIIIVPNSGT